MMAVIAAATRLAAALIALAVLLHPADGQAQAAPKTLRFIPQADLRSIDPIWTTAYVTRNFGYLVFDTGLPPGDYDVTVDGKTVGPSPVGTSGTITLPIGSGASSRVSLRRR